LPQRRYQRRVRRRGKKDEKSTYCHRTEDEKKSTAVERKKSFTIVDQNASLLYILKREEGEDDKLKGR